MTSDRSTESICISLVFGFSPCLCPEENVGKFGELSAIEWTLAKINVILKESCLLKGRIALLLILFLYNINSLIHLFSEVIMPCWSFAIVIEGDVMKVTDFWCFPVGSWLVKDVHNKWLRKILIERNPPIEWDLENKDFFLFFFLEKFLGVTNK